jgi:hypothetical protein
MEVVTELHGVDTHRLEFDVPAADGGCRRCRGKEEQYGVQQ